VGIDRRIELISGLLAGLLGVLGMAYATFGPIYRNSDGGTATLLEVNGPWALVPVLFLTVLVAAAAAGAYLDVLRRRRGGLILLWGSAVLLVLARVITGFSIGVFLQPAAALGLISAVAGSLAGSHPVRATAFGLAFFWAGSSLLYFVALAQGDTLARVGQALVSGPLFVLVLLVDPRQLLPLLH
jgi:hypothetical protein